MRIVHRPEGEPIEQTKEEVNLYRRGSSFRELPLPKKLGYIWDYYRRPILSGLLVLFLLTSILQTILHPATPLLYAAFVNVSLDPQKSQAFSQEYVKERGLDPKRDKIALYTGLYLTDDTSSEAFSYSYASRIKILSSIDEQHLDLVFFDKEAYDAFAQNGFLLNLTGLSLPEGSTLTENLEIREEEKEEMDQEEAEREEAERKDAEKEEPEKEEEETEIEEEGKETVT